jgi:hypothetical protein
MTGRDRRPSSGSPVILTDGLHGASARWAAAVVGCLLGGLALAAILHRLAADSPLVAFLTVCAPLWLVWVASDFAFSPLRAAPLRARAVPRHAGLGRSLVQDPSSVGDSEHDGRDAVMRRRGGDLPAYFFDRVGARGLSVGVEPAGAIGLTGSFFGFFASLLPRWPLDMIFSFIETVAGPHGALPARPVAGRLRTREAMTALAIRLSASAHSDVAFDTERHSPGLRTRTGNPGVRSGHYRSCP